MKYDIKSLTLEEKMQLLTGKDTWRLESANGKLPEAFLSDGPNGLRMIGNDGKTKPATAMPNIHVLANSWDAELAYLDGATIADDCIENGADVLLAPGVNIKRSPLCGRNFEYFSEDPLVAGVLAKAYIEGVQSKGIGTSLKHYCTNNSELDRHAQSSELDERTLREIYLPAFEIAVQAKPWTVMCAYNPVNGVYASENKWLLKDILRDEFGFDGLIVSDWDAVHHSARAVKATLDLRMPYAAQAYGELKTAYDEGWLTEEEIDARVEKILQFIEKTQNNDKKVTTTKEQRHENAKKIALEGMVLLKNEDNILPLKAGDILVGGAFKYGTALGGGGSAYVETEYKQKPLAKELSERLGCQVKTSAAYVTPSEEAFHLRVIEEESYGKDAVVLCMGTNKKIESESSNRTSIRLSHAQEAYIDLAASANENVIVVLESGSAVDMSPWIDKVKAVLFAGFSGEAGQEAIADILTGKACPCGKLTETFPICLEDTSTGGYQGDYRVDKYGEGVLVGYRWFDTKKKEVLFPFGHGLSYAQFEYSDLTVEKESETDYRVCFTVKNVSDVDGKEISQVYVRDVFSMVERPLKELKGFEKTTLKAGESKRVCIKLDARAFAYYSAPLKKWQVENGDFEILVGASSRDIRLTEKIKINLPASTQYSTR